LKSSLFRGSNRIPVLTWKRQSERQEGVLLRSSKLLVGVTGARSREDESLIDFIAKLNPNNLKLKIINARFEIYFKISK
jgi:hypothetical protein